jgi:malate synthase
MTRRHLEEASRQELVAWLEGARCVACYDDEPTELLRDAALEDFDTCGVEEGFADE